VKAVYSWKWSNRGGKRSEIFLVTASLPLNRRSHLEIYVFISRFTCLFGVSLDAASNERWKTTSDVVCPSETSKESVATREIKLAR